jgi:CheY-like chemotaxis protein
MPPIKRLSALRVLHFDPLANQGAVMVRALHAIGLTGAQSLSSVEAAQQAVLGDLPHALMVDMDAEQPADDMTTLVRRIRRGLLGADPFIATIACSSVVTTETARKYAAAGFDQILSKPISPDAVLLHLRELAGRPRRFIADRGYVGPDRRRSLRTIGEAGTMEVPNRMAIALAGASFDPKGYAARVANWRMILSKVEAA